MGKIGLLDISVANLIAAGEVVDRPASVIKELMENSIDAGATEVTVEIKNGGITLMRVADNGCGMSREDAALCVSRHATSKIHSAADLDGIATLGFRGEALAAISSVSAMRIMTRRKEDAVGTMVTVDCGTVASVDDAGCRVGTTVIVEELFRNVPARRKFLKKDQSEAMAITAVVEKIALSRPDIAVKLISDGIQKIQTAGDGKLLNAIYAVLGREFASKLIPVQSMTGGIGCCGYIGRPDNVRANRNYQNFFINGRYVKSRTAAAALEQAFSSYLESEKFPCCILALTIHPSSVDVNVHPTKLEVKFSNERAVFDAVYCAVRDALLNDTARPEMTLPGERRGPIKTQVENAYRSFTPVPDRAEGSFFRQIDLTKPVELPKPAEPEKPSGYEPVDLSGLDPTFRANLEKVTEMLVGSKDVGMLLCAEDGEREEALDQSLSENWPGNPFPPIVGGNSGDLTLRADDLPGDFPLAETLAKIGAEEPAEPETAPETQPQELPEYRLIGTAFGTYIIVELEQKLLIIDKHAAHERILFEEMKANMQKGKERYAQVLLLPIEPKLTAEEFAAASDYAEEITAVGFAYTAMDGAVSITEIPGGLSTEQATDLFVEMAGRLAAGTGDIARSRDLAFEKALYQASCKAAIKAGQTEDAGHLKYVVDKLLRIPNLRYCPHGRPVAFELSKSSIEHQFKRA